MPLPRPLPLHLRRRPRALLFTAARTSGRAACHLQHQLPDIRREYLTEKGCAPNCTISCVHQTSLMDFWRDPQTGTSHEVFHPAPKQPELVTIQVTEKESAMAD